MFLFEWWFSVFDMLYDTKGTVFLGGAIAVAVGLLAYWHSRNRRSHQKADPTVTEEEPVEFSVKNKRKVLLLGLQGAGKSSLMAALSKNVTEEIAPTKGFNVLNVKIKNADFEIWEIGGASQSFWHNFFDGTDLLVYTVDASGDKACLDKSKTTLQNLLSNNMLKNIPCIVVANKQDVASALSGVRLSEQMKLSTIGQSNIPVIETSVPSLGLEEGSAKFSELENYIFDLA